MTDEILRLVVYAQGGNKDSYGLLYEHYAKDMYRFALSICKNPENAEDAVQEAAISVYKSLPRLHNPEKFKTYLFTALFNACKKTFGEITEEIPETLSAESSDYISADVKSALNTLDAQSREIVLLSVIGGFKSNEIAKIVGISPQGVRTKKKRALSKIRKELE